MLALLRQNPTSDRDRGGTRATTACNRYQLAATSAVTVKVVPGIDNRLPHADGSADAAISAWRCAPSTASLARWPSSAECSAQEGPSASWSTPGPKAECSERFSQSPTPPAVARC
jgi:hypothetical protein